MEQTPALRQLSDPSFELTKPHLLPSLRSSFTRNWKHCSLANFIQVHPLLPTSLLVSTPNTIHQITIAVWLCACLNSVDLDRLLTDFVMVSACEETGSRDFAFVGAVKILSLRLRCSFGSNTGRSLLKHRKFCYVMLITISVGSRHRIKPVSNPGLA